MIFRYKSETIRLNMWHIIMGTTNAINLQRNSVLVKEGLQKGEIQLYRAKDNSESPSTLESEDWTSFTLKFDGNILLFESQKTALEQVCIDQDFEVASEQSDEKIFSIIFRSQNGGLKYWKLKVRDTNEYNTWTSLLKQARRPKWLLSKACRVRLT